MDSDISVAAALRAALISERCKHRLTDTSAAFEFKHDAAKIRLAAAFNKHKYVTDSLISVLNLADNHKEVANLDMILTQLANVAQPLAEQIDDNVNMIASLAQPVLNSNHMNPALLGPVQKMTSLLEPDTTTDLANIVIRHQQDVPHLLMELKLAENTVCMMTSKTLADLAKLASQSQQFSVATTT